MGIHEEVVSILSYKVITSFLLVRRGRPPWSIKFILPEFVSYLGEREVMYVGNGFHFCTPVLMSMSNITFQVLRLSTFVFNKCSEKKYSRLYL